MILGYGVAMSSTSTLPTVALQASGHRPGAADAMARPPFHWRDVLDTMSALMTPARRDGPSTIRLGDPSWWSV